MEYPEATLRALLGQAIGDAFGAPFEYHKRGGELAMRSMAEERYLDSVEDVGNRAKWSRTPGLYTDDTQQALALLRACAEADNYLDAQEVGDSFIEIIAAMYDAWVPGSLAGVHRGTGKNFREVARNRAPVETAGLGAAMRIGPAATLMPDLDTALRWSVVVSQVTTTHPIALSCAALFAAHCHALAHNQEEGLTDRILEWLDTSSATNLGLPRAAWLEPLRAIAVFNALGEPELLAYATETGLSNKALDCAANGFALTGLPWVIHHGRAPTFPDALLGACASGGDADTVAAMAGCLSTLRHGTSSIPGWMCDQLLGVPAVLDPGGWDPIRSELPLTQREETARKQALLREFSARAASRRQPVGADFSRLGPPPDSAAPPNSAPLFDGEEEDDLYEDDEEDVELFDDEDDPLAGLPTEKEPPPAGEEDKDSERPGDQLKLFS